jgi:hypothetical protein
MGDFELKMLFWINCESEEALELAGEEGFEPSEWRYQKPLPYHLATPQ